MYEEEKKGLPIKTFLISLILIIIFVLLLVWLLPMPNMKGLNDRIFNANIQEMKNAAIPYFTTDKLPQKVGDKVTLTLQDMIDQKLLLPFTDKNGDSCDTKNSYVSLTKTEDAYELKVFLKCNDQEDYIIVPLGCYSYCTSAVCEKEEPQPNDGNGNQGSSGNNPTPPQQTGPYCELVADGTVGNNGWRRSDVIVKFKTKATTTSGAKITDYGLGTGEVTYNRNTLYTVTKDGVTTVYGYVKDSTGKTATCSIVVKKDTVKPDCSLSVLSGTKASDGSYSSDVVVGFSSRTDATSGVNAFGLAESATETFNSNDKYTVNTNGNHKVYGYVKDNAGNVSKCDISVKRNAKDTSSHPTCELKISSGKLGSNGWYLGNVNVEFAKKSTTNGATINGFGLGTSETYENNTVYTVTKDGVTTVYGYVKDSYGNTGTCSITVKKDQTKPSCSLKVTNGTFNSNGYYTSDVTIGFNSTTDAASGVNAFGIGKSETYAGNTTYTVNAVGKHTVYGYVRDNAGNTAVCSIEVEKRGNIEYRYKKEFKAQYGNWGEWTTGTYNPSNPPAFGSYSLIEVVDLGKSSEIVRYSYTQGDPIYQDRLIKVGTITQTYCTDYKYYRTTTTSGTKTYAVKEGEDWVDQGLVITDGIPTNTLAVRYDFVGYDWSDCGTGCTRTSKKVWRKYTRNVYTVTSEDTVTSSGVTVRCSATATKEVEIFGVLKTVVGHEEVRTPVYGDVYKYKQRRRTLVKEAYTDYKWSTYNDKTLLDQGYAMTGETRVVQ